MKIVFFVAIILNIIVGIYLGYYTNDWVNRESEEVKKIKKICMYISIGYIVINFIFLLRFNIIAFLYLIWLMSIIASSFCFINKAGVFEMCALIFLSLYLALILMFENSIINYETTNGEVKFESSKGNRETTIELTEFGDGMNIYCIMKHSSDGLPQLISCDEVDSFEIVEIGNEKLVIEEKIKTEKSLLSYLGFIESTKETNSKYTVYVSEENLKYGKVEK